MKTYGLIGYKLDYSFSRKFFTEKFKNEKREDYEYINFEIDSINEFPELFKKDKTIYGLNCTIPYKEQIVPFLDEIDPEAAAIGAINTVKIIRGKNQPLKLKGYNTDIYGFENSLKPLLKKYHKKALILGTGGASKAVKHILEKLNIEYLMATRKENPGTGKISYSQINKDIIDEFLLIVNTTPLGTYPNVKDCADLPYQYLTKNHLLYDLVYNPEITAFMQHGTNMGATVLNGLKMLRLQAIKSWEIWNS
ncbi:MAG: shikimate dehydrogenase [Prolixibacteraceae bacterium]|nr:shikimate dehydrogenase [Prolixibacteraceae bacterium]